MERTQECVLIILEGGHAVQLKMNLYFITVNRDWFLHKGVKYGLWYQTVILNRQKHWTRQKKFISPNSNILNRLLFKQNTYKTITTKIKKEFQLFFLLTNWKVHFSHGPESWQPSRFGFIISHLALLSDSVYILTDVNSIWKKTHYKQTERLI